MVGKNVGLTSVVLLLLAFTSVSSGQIEVLRPGGNLNQSGYDTLGWRTLDEPSVKFTEYGFSSDDSVAVWFRPSAPCSLIAIRIYPIDIEGGFRFNVWDGSHYDGHITTTDSTDSNGWIGGFEDGQWIPGRVLGHSPVGWSELDSVHNLWGHVPHNVTYSHQGKWIEIPAEYGRQGQIDLGDKPFIISVFMSIAGGWGWAGEDEGTVPYHTFSYHHYDGTGPDGQHSGWFIRRTSLWLEAVVKYYDVTSIEENSETNVPKEFCLYQNYPNPFNPETTIEYTLPEPSRVRVEVYNLLGQVLEVLVDCEKNAGYHVIKWDGSDVPSGVYFYRITTDHFSASKRMVLMK
ncbi:MAG: T9SS type A sorting domain-containing protein [Gemmatimonadota bacterium]|nr:MAG: T9SS type A sorting domain-containing protein [Gemmatimonadota bacterium]